jgi:cation diffusion facilitator family transporter
MKEKIAIISVLVNLFLAIGKITIGFLTGVTSVLADGVHSGTDVFSSGISLMGIKIAKKPIDKKHPYGHYKFEVLSGLIITILLFGTGFWITYQAYKSFLNPEMFLFSYLTLAIILLSAILNEIMARLKNYYGKKENSLSLLADGTHDKIDVYTSVAVFIGLIIMPYWIYIDAILALLIGIYIIKKSFSLGKEATDSLLDVSAGDEIENKIKEILANSSIEVADLKTQKKGSAVTANIEIKLPKDISVEEATKISNGLQKELIEKIIPLEYVAIQIKSHDFTNLFFQPKDIISKVTQKKGFGWQRKGRFEKEIKEAEARGPGGYCSCSSCGYEIIHERGVPCSTLKCPNCKISLNRK